MRILQPGTVALAVALVALAEASAIRRMPSLTARDHPAAVLVSAWKGSTRSEACGTLLAPTVVLTAAHAVRGFDRWEVLAPYGRGSKGPVACTTARAHPEYRPENARHDLALLFLEKPLDPGGAFPLLHRGPPLPIGTRLVVVGRVDNGKVSHSDLFLTATTLVQYPGDVSLYGGNPEVAQEGDSGGPLFRLGDDREIVAVVSGAIGRRRANVPTDRYTPLAGTNTNWILEQVRERTRDR